MGALSPYCTPHYMHCHLVVTQPPTAIIGNPPTWRTVITGVRHSWAAGLEGHSTNTAHVFVNAPLPHRDRVQPVHTITIFLKTNSNKKHTQIRFIFTLNQKHKHIRSDTSMMHVRVHCIYNSLCTTNLIN